MILEKLVVGPLGVNCYILGDEGASEALVIDPGGNLREILAVLEKHRLRVQAIVGTHAHFDHVIALNDMRAKTGAPFLLHADDALLLTTAQKSAALFALHIPQPAPADRLLKDGDTVQMGAVSLRVLHTPGHSPGGICLLGHGVVLTGDTLFQGSIGRTDLPGGDYGTLMRSIRDKLLALPDATAVYPGHGAPTTIGEERQINPFLRPLITGQWNV
jgi:hydroxyacylglutathione hydrolase